MVVGGSSPLSRTTFNDLYYVGRYDTAKRKSRKLTGKFIRMCEVYKLFSHDWKDICDYDDDCRRELNVYESTGKGECRWNNGYYIGKKYMDVTVKMWREDIKLGTLFVHELYEGDKYPSWWLDKVLKNMGR